MGSEALIAGFANYYEANPEAAWAARDELQTKGFLPDHPYRQLGLSVALTPPERRCKHYGDTAACPYCRQEGLEAQKELKQARQETAEVTALLRAVLKGDGRAAYIAKRRFGYGA